VQWTDAEGIARFTPLGDNPDPEIVAAVAQEASNALYEISGRQFSGPCERVVRPCRQACDCFGFSPAAGLGPWYWTSAWWGGAGGWNWRNECGDKLGCEPMSRVRLAGYPVRAIIQVLIDGAVVDPSEYRLDEYRWLTRLDDPGHPDLRAFWPGCQNMSLNSDQPGTFEVSYVSGIDPPQIGRDAAAQLAAQLYIPMSGGQTGVLPAGVTKSVRQGVTVERGLLANWFEKGKPTGLVFVDTFLAAYWASRGQRRPAVFSPDLQTFARPLG
jgi:hypothetical protein